MYNSEYGRSFECTTVNMAGLLYVPQQIWMVFCMYHSEYGRSSVCTTVNMAGLLYAPQ